MQIHRCDCEKYCVEKRKGVVTGYWENFDSLLHQTVLPLTQVPAAYTHVNIAFAQPDDTGRLFLAGRVPPAKAEILAMRARGQQVLLSIGGAGAEVSLDTPEKVRVFSESLLGLIDSLGVGGIDIDVEKGMPATGTPCAPDGALAGLIQALDYVLAQLSDTFELTFAPETVSLVGGMVRYSEDWGNYLPLIMHFANRLTRVHMQYYNSGPMRGLNGELVTPGTVDFLTALTENVIEGFPIANTGCEFPGLPPHKVAIGLTQAPQAAINGYMPPNLVNNALLILMNGAPCYGYHPARQYTDLGGVMGWSVNFDADQNFMFVNTRSNFFCCCPPRRAVACPPRPCLPR